MNNLENKNSEIEQAPKPLDIKFEKQKGAFLISVDKSFVDSQKVRSVAEKRGLIEKSEVHLTIIGSDTAEAIFASLEKLSEDEKMKVLEQIQVLARRTNWKFNFKPEFYYIKKTYNNPDPDDPSKVTQEIR